MDNTKKYYFFENIARIFRGSASNTDILNKSNIKNSYRPDIDGLRALAVLIVMIYHLDPGWLPGGFVGVDVFFVISGYVVTASLATREKTSILNYLSTFYAKRLARIIPALTVMLVASSLFFTFFIPGSWLSDLSEKTGLSAYFGLSNWVLQSSADNYFSPRAEFNIFTHTWSLGVEEQFYIVAPLLLLLIFLLQASGSVIRIWMAYFFLLILSVFSFALACYLSAVDAEAAFYFIGSRFWQLSSGSLLFLVSRTGVVNSLLLRFNVSSVLRLLPFFGVALIAFACWSGGAGGFPVPWGFVPVLGAILFIVGVNKDLGDVVTKVFSTRLMLFLGLRSYSLYLWHWPTYVAMKWTLGLTQLEQKAFALAFTFLFAELSYRFVELPLRYSSFISGLSNWKRICFFLLFPAMGVAATYMMFDNKTRFSLSKVDKNYADWHASPRMSVAEADSRQCSVKFEVTSFLGGTRLSYTPQNCSLAEHNKHVYVAGDSHAGMLASLFDQLSAEFGYSIDVFSGPGCGFIDLKHPIENSKNPRCSNYVKGILDYIGSSSSNGDVLVLPSLRLDRFGDQWSSFNVRDMYQKMYSSPQLELRSKAVDDAEELLSVLSKKGVEVVFVAPTPIFTYPPFRCSDWFNQNNPICESRSRKYDFYSLRAPVLDGMSEIERLNPMVSIWDPALVLCPGLPCSTMKDGRPLFFDGDHVSGFGASLLYDSLKNHLQQIK